MKKINQNGDTIIEVLLSLAVLGMVIGAAYAISSRSIIRAQQAQERVQAVKIAEGQVDKLKYLFEDEDLAGRNGMIDTVKLPTPKHCLVNDGGSLATKEKPDCVHNNIFTYYISYDTTGSDIYSVYVEWDGLGSGTAQKVVIQYRI